MTSTHKAEVTLPNDTQILITRDFDAPSHLVWRAFTEPELISRWWTAKRGKIADVEVDLRVGGGYRYAMVVGTGGEMDGTEIAFHGTYREIVPDERIVHTEVYEAIPGAQNLNTITLTDLEGGRTRMEMLIEHDSKEMRDGQLESGMEDGLQDALDLLEEEAQALA